MRLAIFDVDYTLVRSKRAGGRLYNQVFQREAGIDLAQVDWTRITASTDPGIMKEVFLQSLGRPPAEGERARIRDALGRIVSQALAADPEFTVPMPGVPGVLALLPGQGWQVAIASGSWRVTASQRLTRVGVAWQSLPAVFGDLADRRHQLITLAVERAKRHYQDGNLEAAVYLGDGRWDLKAAQRAGLGFVGVASGRRAQKLIDAGARTVIPDFEDFDGLLGALAEAACQGA